MAEAVGFELVLRLEPVDISLGWGGLAVPFGNDVVVSPAPSPGQSDAVTMA